MWGSEGDVGTILDCSFTSLLEAGSRNQAHSLMVVLVLLPSLLWGVPCLHILGVASQGSSYPPSIYAGFWGSSSPCRQTALTRELSFQPPPLICLLVLYVCGCLPACVPAHHVCPYSPAEGFRTPWR